MDKKQFMLEQEFEHNHNQKTINLHVSADNYIDSREFEYQASIERISLDKEKELDVNSRGGFIISEPQSIKKDLKAENGIFSTKFGQGLSDMNPFIDRYSCFCGETKSHINNGLICPHCGQPVKFVGDDYSKFGWIQITQPYYVIHPNLYSAIEYLFGPGQSSDREKRSKLYNIINYNGQIDANGIESVPDMGIADQPFYGIGMIAFHERFDEIMNFYIHKYPKKIDTYNMIMNDRDKVFTQSIPVFTTHLRPFDVRDGSMYFEPINAYYNLINNFVYHINESSTSISNKDKRKNSLLFDLQQEIQKLYDEIIAILSGKKGRLRQLIGGRFNFSSRSVIAQDPSLRVDQVKLPYVALAIMLQQKIINILSRTYNIRSSEAYQMWFKGVTTPNKRIYDIIMSIINYNPEGLQVIINRNPTIQFGSILSMYCIGINDNFTMSIPLQVLRSLAADFDGDVLNIFVIISEPFAIACNEIFNPRNNMYISHNNGLTNPDLCVQRDTIINANTLLWLGRQYQKDTNRISHIQSILKRNENRVYNKK